MLSQGKSDCAKLAIERENIKFLNSFGNAQDEVKGKG